GAAIGREFSHTLLTAVARKPEPEVASALNRIIAAGLLFRQGVPPDASYLFKHALVQDAAYGTLLREPRRALHARIAETLANTFADIVQNQPELLAFVPLQGSSSDLFAQPPFSGFNSPVMPGQSLNNTPETDIITANASDSLGNKAIPAAINVTVNPTAPTVTSTTVSRVEQQAIALHLASQIATNGQAGSFLNAVTLTFTVPPATSIRLRARTIL